LAPSCPNHTDGPWRRTAGDLRRPDYRPGRGR